MLNDETPERPEEGMRPLRAAAELQDHLMTGIHDLDRLQRLLDDAGEALSFHFFSASNHIAHLLLNADRAPDINRPALDSIKKDMTGAITALQFHDMATQLIAHTSQRLRNCADQLAKDTFGDDDEDGVAVVGVAPLHPNPVTQDEVDAGSIELF